MAKLAFEKLDKSDIKDFLQLAEINKYLQSKGTMDFGHSFFPLHRFRQGYLDYGYLYGFLGDRGVKMALAPFESLAKSFDIQRGEFRDGDYLSHLINSETGIFVGYSGGGCKSVDDICSGEFQLYLNPNEFKSHYKTLSRR